jgi:CubicO group peptidase (beta-lactamase class C family)
MYAMIWIVAASLAVIGQRDADPAATTAPRAPRPSADPHDTAFAPVAKVLEAAVADGAFPGCVATIGNADGPLWTQAFGHLAEDDKQATSTDTIYDLASLTKVLGTTAVVAALIRDGKLKLDDPLERLIPEFVAAAENDTAEDDAAQAVRRRVTIEQLLTHCSGLPAGRPLYKTASSYKELVAEAARTKLSAAPGEKTVYSDLGFILLGEAAAQAAGKPLAELEQALVFRPLSMRTTFRSPGEELRSRIAPTERIAGTSDEQPKYVHGVVHDENARAAEGLTGHAGLFSTAADVGRFAQEWLRALNGKSDVWPGELAEKFVTRRNLPPGSSRALGWDTPSGRSSSGTKMPRAFGHTGFTGTSIWIDPQRGIFVVLLTNRVHPTRANQTIHAVRRQFADAAVEAVEQGSGVRGRGSGKRRRGRVSIVGWRCPAASRRLADDLGDVLIGVRVVLVIVRHNDRRRLVFGILSRLASDRRPEGFLEFFGCFPHQMPLKYKQPDSDNGKPDE